MRKKLLHFVMIMALLLSVITIMTPTEAHAASPSIVITGFQTPTAKDTGNYLTVDDLTMKVCGIPATVTKIYWLDKTDGWSTVGDTDYFICGHTYNLNIEATMLSAPDDTDIYHDYTLTGFGDFYSKTGSILLRTNGTYNCCVGVFYNNIQEARPELNEDNFLMYIDPYEDQDMNCAFYLDSPSYQEYSGYIMENYTGEEIKPEVTLYWYKDKDTRYTLTEGKDYTLTYSDNIEPGKATLTITGLGDVSGSKTLRYYIFDSDPVIYSLENTTKGIDVNWSGALYADKFKIYLQGDISEDDDPEDIYIGSTFRHSYTIPKKYLYAGANTQYQVIVVAVYSGASAINTGYWRNTYYLAQSNIKKLSSTSKGKIKVTWSANKRLYNGYEVMISTKSSFTKNTASYKISKKTQSSKTISHLTSGKKYYVRFRAFKYYDDQVIYSPWSVVKKITVK